MNAPPIETQEARTGRLPPRPGVGALTDPRSWARLLLTNEFGLAALIAIFGAVFALGTPGFGSSFNLFTLGRTMAIDIVIGFSMMVVIVTGGLNLSVGAIGVCSAAMFGWLLERAGFPVPLAVGAALALGGALGAVNGILIVRSGLHSFIITLATMSIFFGMMIFLSRAEAFRNLPAEVSAFGKMRFFGYLSPALLVSLLIGILLTILYRLTRLGREMLAAGAKPAAAELSGVRVGRTFILCHVLSGVLAGIAAMMVVARTGAAIPSMAGDFGSGLAAPGVPRPGPRRHRSGGRACLRAGLVPRLGDGQRTDQRSPAISRRRVLGADVAGAASAARRPHGSRAAHLPRQDRGACEVTTTLRSILRTDWFGPLAIIVVATIVMTAFDPSFLSPFNMQILLLAAAVNSVIAMSQMVIIAIGQMNLSIGAIGGLSAICFAGMMQVWGLPPIAAAAAALGIGALAGFANGLLIARTGISAFIITLASLSIFKGADLGITRAQPFYKIPESVKAFGNTTIFGPIPWLAVPAALVVAGVWYLLYRQRIGRYMLAVGGNANAAELSGVSIERTVIVGA